MAEEAKGNIKTIIALLSSGNKVKQLQGIHEARTNGNLKVFPYLLDVIEQTEDNDVLETACQLLFDTKKPEALPILMDRIKSCKSQHKQAVLASALWQADFDCEDLLEDLVDLAIEGNLHNAIEIFTVIDNIESELPYDLVSDLNLTLNEWIVENPKSDKANILESIAFSLNEKAI